MSPFTTLTLPSLVGGGPGEGVRPPRYGRIVKFALLASLPTFVPPL